MFTDMHVFYPVVDEGGTLIGSVRLQDVAEVDRDATVAEVMSREVATIGPDAAATEAFRRIEESRARRLVVIGPDGELLGIVSTTDLLRAVQIRLVDRSKARD
jgi:predicted transcriptional regulator